MSGVGKRVYLRDVNPYLICPLCRGYLIDATTVVECLHSFCRSCIIKHLNKESRCPSCKLDLNKAKPDIKSDQVLQDIVYKLVPGLYYKEMRRRKEFYKKHPEHAESTTSEQRGEDVRGRLIFTPEDAVSLSLEYLPPGADPIKILSETNDTASNKSPLNNSNNNEQIGSSNRHYLQCPALVTIAHLKKFLAMKYSIDMTRYTIEIYHSRAALPEHFTLMDVALIYAWRRNAPIRFFYRVAHEEQRLEAPPHDRPSTPGLGASLPPIENNQINDENDNDKEENEKNDNITNQLIETKETNDKNSRIRKIIKRVISSLPATSTIPITTLSTPEVVTSTAAETTSADSNTTAVVNSSEEAKQIKTPIKILKNPDGKYEVIKSPPPSWNGVEPVANGSPQSKTPSSLEFSVVSIGDGQNSNGVKITLKQCSPGNNNNNNNNSNSSNNNNNNNNNNSKKPKMTSNILLRQSDKELPNAFMIQHLTADKDKQTQDKQEKQKRRVTFMEKPLITTSDSPKINLKKPTEQTDKKQFLQSFQLTAKESIEHVIPDSSSKLNSNSANSSVEVTRSTPERIMHKTLSSQKTSPCKIDEITKKISDNNTNPNKISEGNINSPVTNNLSNNFRGNIKNQIFGMTNNLVTNISAISSNHSSKLDVYAFPNDPPIVPAGAVKRKSPPGLPTHEAKRKKPMPNQGNKKQINTVQSPNKSPRKSVTDKILHIKKPINILPDPGPSRQCMPSSKSTGNPILLTDTRNLLDGCGLNIPASLSITLTAPKSPGNNTLSSESADSKDTRKNILGKVNPSITLNDRSVDPCVLKALKTGKMKMPSPPKPKQTKQVERGVNAPRQTQGNKRKRDQNSRDILDLSGSKKMDIHPLRIPQPVAKLKPKTVRETIPAMPDQNQVVTFMGHKYYRAPPGSLTPAACRMSDAQIPTPTRTPVYAPAGLSTSLGSNTSRAGNLSSVFPSLQSLYALSQAPNLQQFQMDAKLRLPRSSGDATSSTSNTVNVTTYNCSTPNKTHLAAQCAPVKPARSSLVSLAVPISKQSLVFPTISRPNVTTDSSKSLTSNTQASDNDVNQRLTLQSTNSTESKHSSSADDTNLDDNVERQKAKSEKNDSDLSETKQSETASPRVSSTASPSPPPNDTSSTGNTSDNNEANNATNNISGNSDTSASPLVSNSEKSSTVEIINTKSPASPDSSSVTVENSTKTSMDQGIVSPDKTSDLKLDSPEKTTNLPDDSITDSEKTKINSSPKPQESIQLTSEILQKRFLAAFPSNEWANNPIAAEHLGKFLKSLNASIKSEDKTESCNTEKSENKPINIDKKLVDDDVSVKTKKENEKKA